ncbi:unnamed protein product [Ixodes persulcatus]
MIKMLVQSMNVKEFRWARGAAYIIWTRFFLIQQNSLYLEYKGIKRVLHKTTQTRQKKEESCLVLLQLFPSLVGKRLRKGESKKESCLRRTLQCCLQQREPTNFHPAQNERVARCL